MVQYTAGTALKPGTPFESTVDPYWWLQYQQYGTGAEQWGMSFEEQIRQFDEGLAHDIERAELDYKRAIEVAQINAGATGAIAEANVRAAEIAAAEARFRSDTLMKIARLDNQTKLTIAREANKIEAMKWEATRFQHPSKWAEQEHWFAAGGAPAIETPTRSVVPQLPSGAGVPTAGPQTPPSYWPEAETAVVGEAGPEVAAATPQGTQFTPVSPGQAMQLKQIGVPSMQWGGTVTAGTALKPPASSSQWGGRVGGGEGGRFQPSPDFRFWGGAKAPAPFKQGQGPQVDYMPGRGWLAGGTPVKGIDVSQGTPTGTGIWPGYGRRGGVATGGAAGGGAAGGGAAGGGGGAAAGTTTDPTRSVLSYLRGDEPMPSWGGQELGEFQIPGGENYGIVPLPGQINLVDFLNLPYDMQQMYLSATEATYSMTPQTAMQGMTYFAPRGIAQPVAIWG